jgi:hypothetical protein
MQSLARAIKSKTSSEDQRIEALSKVFFVCLPSTADNKRFQDAAIDTNMIGILIGIVLRPYSKPCRHQAFLALGSIAFHNEKASSILGKNTDFVHHVSFVLSEETEQQEFQFAALNAASNTAFCEEVHPVVQILVPQVVKRFYLSTHDKLRGQIVTFLGLLAYNPKCSSVLIQSNALSLFQSVISSQNHNLRPASAALSMANLSGFPSDNEVAARVLVKQLIDVLKPTLEGQDYPLGSVVFYTTWKVMRSIANACRMPFIRKLLLSQDIISLIRSCLGTDDPRAKSAALEALWLLSTDE